MSLVLNVYTDDTLTELKRVVEADRLKIPYRVAMYLLQSLDNVDINNDEDLIKFVMANVDKLDKIIKATYGVSELELECVDGAELIECIKELYVWVLTKANSLNVEGTQKNV